MNLVVKTREKKEMRAMTSNISDIESFIGSFTDDDYFINEDNQFVIDSKSKKLNNYLENFSAKFNIRKTVNVYDDYDYIYFENITDENSYRKSLKIELNGTIYNVCQFYDYQLDYIFSSNGINWNKDTLRNVDGFDEFFDKNVNSIQEISEMKRWQNELNSISDNAYGDFHRKEINELCFNFISNYHRMSKKIADDVIEKYFNYSDSFVKDLSIVDDVKCFFFGDTTQLFWSLSKFFTHCLHTVFYFHFKKDANPDLFNIFNNIFHYKGYSPEETKNS